LLPDDAFLVSKSLLVVPEEKSIPTGEPFIAVCLLRRITQYPRTKAHETMSVNSILTAIPTMMSIVLVSEKFKREDEDESVRTELDVDVSDDVFVCSSGSRRKIVF
jgi:hypothetical protein